MRSEKGRAGVMQTISPLWWARSLGTLTLFVVVALRWNEGVPLLSLLDQAVWSMLLASVLGFAVGSVLQSVLGVIEPAGGHEAAGPVDTEMPGTMPPLT